MGGNQTPTCLRSSLLRVISAAFSSLLIPIKLPAAFDGRDGVDGALSSKSSSQPPGIAGVETAGIEGIDRAGVGVTGVACEDSAAGGFKPIEFCASPVNKGGGDLDARLAGVGFGDIVRLMAGEGFTVSWSRLSSQPVSSSTAEGPLWKSAMRPKN